MESPEKIMGLLKDFFDLIFKCIIEFYQNYEGTPGLYVSGLEDYTYGQFGVRIRNFVKSVSEYIHFIEEYVKLVLKWFEVFSYLIDALGTQEYRILFRQVSLEEVINTTGMDIQFLKFRIKNFLNPTLSDLETICRLLLKKSEDIREEITNLKFELSESFLELVENQTGVWLDIHKEVQSTLNSAIQLEDKSEIIRVLTLIVQKFIDFFKKISETKEFLNVPDENWERFVEGGFVEFFDRSKKLKEDAIEYFEHMIKAYEHAQNCFLYILAVLWGTEEEARLKIEGYVKSEIPFEDLIPKNFSLEDLAFGLALARSELGQARFVSQVLDEKRKSIDIIANYFRSEGFKDFYNRTIKNVELRKKYLNKIDDIMIDIQNLVQKNYKLVKHIFRD